MRVRVGIEYGALLGLEGNHSDKSWSRGSNEEARASGSLGGLKVLTERRYQSKGRGQGLGGIEDNILILPKTS